MSIFWDALWDSTKDTLLVIPLLYLAYLIVEYFAHNNNHKYQKLLHRTRQAGPAIGAFLGCIPQCGFSSMMSKLYSKNLITLGTLLAVFITTSDEAIIIMLSHPNYIGKMFIMIGIKIAYALIIGYAIDLIFKLFNRKKKLDVMPEEIKSCDIHGHEIDSSHEHIHHCDCLEHGSEHHQIEHDDCCATNIFLHALKHTAIITLYVFIATLAIRLIIDYCGIDQIQKIFSYNIYLQIVVAALVGLIPNCAASVFIATMYTQGILQFSSMVAGLCAGAGVGLIVLFMTNRGKHKAWVNVLISVSLYALAVVLGIIVNFTGIK